MDFSRRNFMTLLGLTGVGFWLTGCAEKSGLVERPSPSWPEPPTYPQATGTGTWVAPPGAPSTPVVPHGGTAERLPQTPAQAAPITPAPGEIAGPIRAIPRSAWAKAPPIAGKILPMGGVDKITVHHEGWTPVYFADYASTRERMESIRQSHLERLGAGDIGYHYVIDRAGRLWQGRDIRFQGAHVHEHNPHNIGVMNLGNFDLQQPTEAQLATLRGTLIALRFHYRVPIKYLYTHQELNPTECPGTSLQGRMVMLRRNGLV